MVSRQKDPLIFLEGNKAVDDVAKGADGRPSYLAVVVLLIVRRHGRCSAPAQRFLIDLVDVFHLKTDVLDTVAMQQQENVPRILVPQRGGEHQPDAVLPKDVGDTVPVPRFRTEIAQLIKAKGFAIEVCRLQGIADNEFDVMYPFDR